MKYLFLSLCLLLVSSSVSAQSGKAKAEKSDPEAKKILDKLRKKYEAYTSLEAVLSLTLGVTGQPKEVQKGTIGQDGERFRLDMDQQVIVSDAKTTWVYLKKNNEVQISNADGSTGDFLTPKELLSRYDKGDYLYTLAGKVTESGKSYTLVEFKPKDKNSDYSKLQLTLDTKTNTIKSIKAFGKDGSRYTFALKTLTPNKKFSKDHFSFDTSKYPGVKVEDLRI